MTSCRLNVALLIFDGVEVLDFAGPYEVFSRTRTQPGPASRQDDASAPFRVYTVAAGAAPIRATGGLGVVPDHTLENAPPADVLVVPGGFGTRPLLENRAVVDWIRAAAGRAQITTSVCTGALLLARAGLLRGRTATTHWAALDLLEELDPEVSVDREARFVDTGTVVTSAGVAAGMDMAFHLVERLCGREVARETARYIDYPLAN